MNTARALFFAAIVPASACDEAATAPSSDTITAAAKQPAGASGPEAPDIAVRVGPMAFTVQSTSCHPDRIDQGICALPPEADTQCPSITLSQVARTPELAQLDKACDRFERTGPESYELVRISHLAASQVDPHESVQTIRGGEWAAGEANGEPVQEGGTAFRDFWQAAQLLGLGAQAEISYDAGTGIIDGVSIQDAISGAWHVIDIEVTVHPMAGAD